MNNKAVVVSLELAAQQFTAAIKQAQQQFETASKGIAQSAEQAGRAIDASLGGKAGKGAAGEIKGQVAGINRAFKDLAQQAQQAGNQVSEASDRMGRSMRDAGNAMRDVGGGGGGVFSALISGAAAAASAILSIGTAAMAIRKVIDESLNFERLERAMSAAVGKEFAGSEMRFVKDTANKLGVELSDVAGAYTRLAAAAKGTALEGRATRDIFTAITTAGTKLGLSGDQVNGALSAVQQMMSKGRVTAEELRGQLGERIPGAMRIAAQSMGVTEAKFSDLMQKGLIPINEFLPKFAAELQKSLGGGEIADGMEQNLARLRSSITEFAVEVGRSGFIDEINSQIKSMIEWFKRAAADGSLREWARNISDGLKTALEVVIDFGKAIYGLIQALKALAPYIAAAGVALWVGKITAAVTAVRAVATAARAAAAGLAAVEGVAAAASVAVAAIGRALAATGWVAAIAYVVYQFLQVKKSAGDAGDAIKEFKDSLAKIEAPPLDKLIAASMKGAKGEIDKIAADLKANVNGIFAMDRVDNSVFQARIADMGNRLKKINADRLAVEKEIAEKTKQFEQEKAIATRESEAKREAAARQTAEATKQYEKQKQLAAWAGNKAIEEFAKRRLDKVKEASKEEVDEAKNRVEKIKRHEEGLKLAKEALVERTKASEKQLVDEVIALTRKRLQEITATEQAITQAVEQAARAQAEIRRRAISDAIKAYQELGQKQAAEQFFGGESAKQLARETVAWEQYLAERRTLFGQLSGLFTDHEAKQRAHGSSMARIMEQGADEQIRVKEQLRARMQQQLSILEGELRQHEANVKRILSDIQSSADTYDKLEFDIKVQGMSEAEKIAAYAERAMQQRQKMAEINREVAASGRQATEEEVKSFQKAEQEGLSLVRTLSGMGEQGRKAALDIAGGMEQTAKSFNQNRLAMENAAIDGLKKSITEFKGALEQVGQDIQKLAEIKVKIHVAGEAGDMDELQKAFTALKSEAAKGLLLDVSTEGAIAKLEGAQAKAKEPTESQHSIRPDTTAVDAAIERLRQPTSSVHTIYEQRVQSYATGGPIAAAVGRIRGMIRGPGNGTSDSILARVSNGEYVMRSAAVRRWGVGFLNALNAGMMPGLPRYADGGLIAAASGGMASRDTIDLRFNIGGRQHTVQSSRDTAAQLAGALRELARGA